MITEKTNKKQAKNAKKNKGKTNKTKKNEQLYGFIKSLLSAASNVKNRRPLATAGGIFEHCAAVELPTRNPP